MKSRSRLFSKYFVPVALLMAIALLSSSGVDTWFSYRETEAQLVALQQEKANSAAIRIELFIKEIEHNLGWTAFPQPGSGGELSEQRRFDYLKLFRQAPAVSELAWINEAGREQLRISRLAMDVAGSNTDLSTDPRFTNATMGKTYFSPVYFRKDTEPYISIAIPAGAGGGVTIAEVNLKFAWEVISQINVGKTGQAYAVSGNNVLIAHPDISRVLQKMDLSYLAQMAVQKGDPADGTREMHIAADMTGQNVLTAQAAIPMLGWRVFVDLPIAEAFAPIYSSLYRAAFLLLLGLIVSILASMFLAKQMVGPIRMLQDGAARIGAGTLDQRIDVHTGDELESLAEQFNAMAEKLAESYCGLERKVADRTAALAGEQEKTQTLLHNILPKYVIQELAATGRVKPARHDAVSVLFTDFASFTQATSTMPADRMVMELSEIFAAFDEIAHESGVEKIKTIGDAYMAAAGLSDDAGDHAQRSVRAALRMLAFVEARNVKATFKWELRIGIHSGPVISGVVGKRKYAYDIWGDAVNIASRMESSGEVRRVNVSAYTYDLIRAEFDCTYRGKIVAKGKGEIDMYFVNGPTIVIE